MRFISLASIGTLAALMAALVGCAVPKTDAQLVQAMCEDPALKLDNYSQRSLLGAGYKALSAKRYDCAERLLTKAQVLDPKDPYASLNLGVLYHLTERSVLARGAYERVIQLEKLQLPKDKESVVLATDDNRSIRLSVGELAQKNLNLLP